jgi:hypothetical protein
MDDQEHAIPHPPPANISEPPPPPPPPPPSAPAPPPPPPPPAPQYAAPPAPQYTAPPQYSYTYGAAPMIVRNNGFAVASLVTSIASIFFGVFFLPQIAGVIFGHVAMSQIKRSQGREQGSGMAIAGLVIGYLMLAFWLLIVIAAASSGNNSGTNY